MYNLLVTAQKGAWDSNVYEYDRNRFLEHTTDALRDRFKNLTEDNIHDLKSIPCVFAYEGKHPIKIGVLKSIEVRHNILRIKYEFYDNGEIDFARIDKKSILMGLDITEWEMNRTHWAVKDESLFENLSRVVNISEDSLRDKNRSAKLTTNESKVTTVRGFIDKVLSDRENSNNEIFYRGHSDSSYKLVPALFRTNSEGHPLYHNSEEILFRELIISNPHDFINDTCTLDRLIRMQHYSLPTRLLDITSNPLIALYFACISIPNHEKKGEVISFSLERSKIKYFDSDTVSCIANLARLSTQDKINITFSSLFGHDIATFNKKDYIKRLAHFVREEKPFFESKIDPLDLGKIVCVKGKKSNSRISSQSGAFLLFGSGLALDDISNDDIQIKRILIEDKQKILRELDLLNINESTVFPYIENSAKYIANKYKFSEPTK